jgi:hypothetical protein
MHWTRLEQTILEKLSRYPRSMTARERAMSLCTCLIIIYGD